MSDTPDPLPDLLALADMLADAAEDYRAVIPQFHAHNRRKMKARVSSIDEVINELRTYGQQCAALARQGDGLVSAAAALLIVCESVLDQQRVPEMKWLRDELSTLPPAQLSGGG